MPIDGISDQRRLQRFGKIRTGNKVQMRNGKERPNETSFFVLNPEEEITDRNGKITGTKTNPHIAKLIEMFGKEPTELPIVLPVGDRLPDGDFLCAPQALKWYARDRNGKNKLMCKGNGKFSAYRGQGTMAGMNAPGVQYPIGFNRVCDPKTCPQALPEGNKPPKCKPSMTFTFMIPDYSLFGTFAIDTSSVTAMIDLNSTLDLAEKAYFHLLQQRGLLTNPADYKGLAGVPLKLFRKEVSNRDGGVNYPLSIEVDLEKLNHNVELLIDQKASLLSMSSGGFKTMLLENPEEITDEGILDPVGDQDVVDENGEIIGTTSQIAEQEKKQNPGIDLDDPELNNLFNELGTLTGKTVTLKIKKLTAGKFEGKPDQMQLLKGYLSNQINSIKAKAAEQANVVETTATPVEDKTQGGVDATGLV